MSILTGKKYFLCRCAENRGKRGVESAKRSIGCDENRKRICCYQIKEV